MKPLDFKVNVRKLLQALGTKLRFNLARGWFKCWRELFWPITVRSKANAMQSWIIFDTQLKIASVQNAA